MLPSQPTAELEDDQVREREGERENSLAGKILEQVSPIRKYDGSIGCDLCILPGFLGPKATS